MRLSTLKTTFGDYLKLYCRQFSINPTSLGEKKTGEVEKLYYEARRELLEFYAKRPGTGIKTPEGTEWMVYIPDEGHWPIAHKPGATYKEAREAYLNWAGRNQLPKGSFLQLFEVQQKEPQNKV